ncbi:HpcH/HpaI aldolase family protein [Pararhizobium mangrovi]|uniref:HpcH/HpaI aldolase/citrate lyase family protein n=1 Tax=Pararhizobium mangrovi TaxID=2590452 RepID=A0A506UFH6_9HYPH|nr:HpcH/HpaI aldolase/citrate lyase family protein [Pararhizobium mangrovi]TPW32031.1 HpcH/HpaI aldolase/citrate lyase family protein [Pararhizobium mangrovi]
MIENRFKTALAAGDRQIGLWVAAGDPYVASLIGHAGFDWLVIDGEHGPNDLRSILAQLQALESSPSAVVVRPPMGEAWMIKQLLDIGAETLLVPMVETAEQAAELVRAVRYPPVGKRGVGAGIARASRFSTVRNYVQQANENVCLLVQAESRKAMDNLSAIASTEGVDGVFIGPSDLGADMGVTDGIADTQFQRLIERGIETIQASGKPAGILTFNEALNHRYLELGATFVAVGADIALFTSALADLRGRYPVTSKK